MLKSYFKTAFRGFYRQKLYSLINLVGISVGLVCSFMILLWVTHELSVNQFHTDGDRIYQVMRNYHGSGRIHTWGSLPKPASDFFDEQIPEITSTVLVTWTRSNVFKKSTGESFRRSGYFASDDFLEVFSFPLLYGTPDTALEGPNAIAISDRMAEQIFGPDWQKQDLLGRTLLVDNRKDFTIDDIFPYPAGQSSIRFDYLINIEDYLTRNPGLEKWGSSSLRLFVKLNEGADQGRVDKTIRTVINDNNDTSRSFLWLHPLKDIYLRSQFETAQSPVEGLNTSIFSPLSLPLSCLLRASTIPTWQQRDRQRGLRR
jgi:putative ABC transport system permease protein